MPGDENTYGFNANDAQALINGIEGPARVFSEWQPVPSQSGSSESKIVKATSGISARSGTTVSSATCTEFKNVTGTLTTNTNTITVYNLSAVAVPTDAYVLAHREAISSNWFCEPAIVGLRLSGSNLQYTIDGTTWTTWHTGTTCA